VQRDSTNSTFQRDTQWSAGYDPDEAFGAEDAKSGIEFAEEFLKK